MGLMNPVFAFLVACLADIRGNSRTRPFTRRAFVLVILVEMGLTLGHLVGAFETIAGAIPL
jgi:hypothetical protein